ncbi:AAA family ATPase [Streptomyces sindenensis]|uniref:AAA family ATPase n=1 Tax=Streptomyces sindenensis TaxID=67363 RepID=A0ABW6EJ40_9ACTN
MNPTTDTAGIAPLLAAGPPPDRTRVEGWQQWLRTRHAFRPAPRMTLAEHRALPARRRALYDLHRTATHVNLRLQETPMSVAVAKVLRTRLQNNALSFAPGTRVGLMVSGGGFQGKTETVCDAAAAFEELWREVHRQLAPHNEPVPGTRDVFVPVAYCRLPVKATPKALCASILDFYGAPHPKTLDGMIRAVRDSLRDHRTTALLLDDITRLRLHREDDQDTLDLVRELMDLNVTLVLIGVDIPRSGLLRGSYLDPATGQLIVPDLPRGRSHNPSAATQTERRFDLVGLDPFAYTTPGQIRAFVDHLAGIEDQLRLLRAQPGMLTGGHMPEYLYRRTSGVIGLLRRLIEDGCTEAMAGGEERLTVDLLDGTVLRPEQLGDLNAQAGELPDIPSTPRPHRRRRPTRGANTVFEDRGLPDAAGEAG